MFTKKYLKSRNVCHTTFELTDKELPKGIRFETVSLVGEFNGWNPKIALMKRSKNKAYKAVVDLEPNQRFQFRYLANGKQWFNDQHADAYVASGNGEENCVIIT